MLLGKKIAIFYPKEMKHHTHIILVNNIECMIPPSESNSQEL